MPAAPRYDLAVSVVPGVMRRGLPRPLAVRRGQRPPEPRERSPGPTGQRGSGRSIRRTAMDETGRAMIQHGAGELADPLLDGSAERAAVAGPGPVAAECR